jgi:hypothetical protein
MKKVIALVCVIVFVFAAPAVAETKKKTNKSAQKIATLTKQVSTLEAQLVELLKTIKSTNVAPGRDGRDGLSVSGAQGAKGDKGDKGETGSVGATGPIGVAGVDGADGADGVAGVAGVDGSGLPSGAIILMNGNCPDGFTIQGAQNRWTVYANDTTGRPWLTSGSSAQLFMSACQVN